MSIESLCSEIDFALGDDGISKEAAYAALNDFVRSLHEVFRKSECDQVDILSQVQTSLGSTPSHHLGRIINADHLHSLRSYPENKACPLLDAVIKICSERGIALDEGRLLFSHLLKALDEERFDEGKCDSILLLTYFSIGPEAAYHIGGLFVGDEASIISDQLSILDYRLQRFYTYIERWNMELAWDKEEEN